MLNKDYTAKLLDLVDVIITKVENFWFYNKCWGQAKSLTS